MAKTQKSSKQAGSRKRAHRVGAASLDKLIAEAIVDCYNESDEVTGIINVPPQAVTMFRVPRLFPVGIWARSTRTSLTFLSSEAPGFIRLVKNPRITFSSYQRTPACIVT